MPLLTRLSSSTELLPGNAGTRGDGVKVLRGTTSTDDATNTEDKWLHLADHAAT